jgi:shikimate dehydrogenase
MNASADPSGTAPVGGTTRLLGVIGWPVEHSLSPAIHNAAFRSLAMDRIYVPLPVEPDDLPRAVEGLRALGFDGANVTMPHKAQSADLADELSDDSRVLHAVNTFVIRDGTVRGENTDVLGFDRFIRQDAAFDPTGCDALILGAGGAARAVALALSRGGAARVVIAVRDVTRANPMIKLLKRVGVQHEVVTFEDVADRSTDLVVNATPVGSDARSIPPLPELGGSGRRANVRRAGVVAPSGRVVVRTVDRRRGADRRDVRGRGARVGPPRLSQRKLLRSLRTTASSACGRPTMPHGRWMTIPRSHSGSPST